MLIKQGFLSQKQKELSVRREENQNKVDLIKKLRDQVEQLRWKVPQKDNNMASLIQEEGAREWATEGKADEENKKASKDADTKRIKFLETKKQMLQKLEKLNVQGNLYQSHRRVILKQYLEWLREKCTSLKQVNSQLEVNQISLEQLSSDYQLLLSKLDEASAQLKASRLTTK